MKTKEEIIKNLKNIYGDKYGYELIRDITSKEKVELVCPKHGIFKSRYDHLLNGCGCQECRKENRCQEKWEDFIVKARKIHGDKYEYTKDEDFTGVTSKVKIICPKHGEFKQQGINHIAGQGCPKCYHEKMTGKYKMTTKEFIEEAKKIHGDRYDYSKTEYAGKKNKLKIICPKHGEFEQVAYDHLRGFGCEKCKYDKNRLTKDEFIERAKKIHGDKYSYEKVSYVNNHTPIIVTCKKHGDFRTLPSWILMGLGCPDCKFLRLEAEVEKRLIEENIKYIRHANVRTLPWLGRQSVDFYLPEKNIAVECQGVQHFKPDKRHTNPVEQYKNQVERDERKRSLCQKNGIKLLYFTHEKDTSYDCFKNINDLFEEIKKQ